MRNKILLLILYLLTDGSLLYGRLLCSAAFLIGAKNQHRPQQRQLPSGQSIGECDDVPTSTAGSKAQSSASEQQRNVVSRRDWLQIAATFSSTASITNVLVPTKQSLASEIDVGSKSKPPKLADEYSNLPVMTNPRAGRYYFPTLTPPFQNRATYRYTLGRNAWALEQLLTFANVTATIRCNVIRLKGGGLWVHSPQYPTGELCDLLEDLNSPVEHIVLPCNAFEHKAPMKAFVDKYPTAQVWVAPGQYGPLGSCGTKLSDSKKNTLGYKVDGIFGDETNPPPPWSDEFDIATLYVDLPKYAGPVSEVAFCHRPTKTLVSTDSVVFVPNDYPNILPTYFDEETINQPNFWPRSVLQAVFLPLRTNSIGKYPGYDAIVDRLVRAPILRAVVDARAPTDVKNWIQEQTKWDFDRIITSHFASPIEATPADVKACFEYLFEDDVTKLSSSNSLPRIACQDWELLDSINQFIAKTNAGEKATFEFQRGCIK